MTHTYHVSGMTCSGCEGKVKNNLLAAPGVVAATVSRANQSATLTKSKHVHLADLIRGGILLQNGNEIIVKHTVLK